MYIILCSNGHFYTGITTHVARRWTEHCAGKGARFFNKRRAPREIVYIEEGHSRSSAAQRECAIKRLTRREKIVLVTDYAKNVATGIVNERRVE